MNTNTILNHQSNIVEDWYGGYKLELDLTAQSNIEDWTLSFELPYKISAAYGVDLTENGDGSYVIQGQNGWKSLSQGESIKPIFIIEDNNQQALPLEILRANSANSVDLSPEDSSSTVASNEAFSAQSNIVEDWHGGYKLELDLTAQSNIEDWTLSFELPYKISAAYGVDLIENGNGSYVIQGQNGWKSLSQGESIKPIFIIEDNNQQALPLEILSSNPPLHVESSPINNSPSNEIPTLNNIESSPVNNSPSNEIVTPIETIVTPADSSEKIINVDSDFGGDLAAAISSANDGEAVQLSGRTYYTSGITISKDITIYGEPGTVINGGGTDNSIIRLTPEASGATIQDLAITNGNNGIYSYAAHNLTLQNLEVHNIGKSNIIASGQNNTGITLDYAHGLQLIDSNIYDIGRKGVSVGDTDGAVIKGLSVQNVNLAANHAQSHDAAGIKFFNTNDIVLRDSYFADINANHIWNDTTNKTTIENNVIENVGSVFQKPVFNTNVDISGIYNEKSSNSVVRDNFASSVQDFAGYNATEFTTETMIVENNDFSISEINTQDYWVNEFAEKLIATVEDPAEADFSLFAQEYLDFAVIE